MGCSASVSTLPFISGMTTSVSSRSKYPRPFAQRCVSVPPPRGSGNRVVLFCQRGYDRFPDIFANFDQAYAFDT